MNVYRLESKCVRFAPTILHAVIVKRRMTVRSGQIIPGIAVHVSWQTIASVRSAVPISAAFALPLTIILRVKSVMESCAIDMNVRSS